jgi:hypothetical protein
MRVPAVTVGVTTSVSAASVYGSGEFGRAVAGWLAAAGHRIRLVGDNHLVPQDCDLWTQGRTHFSGAISIDADSDLTACRMDAAIVVAVPATEYGAVAEDLADTLVSGQTVFIVGAAFGAALEMAQIIERSRQDLAISLIETAQPFAHYEADGKCVRISGAKDKLAIAGRTLNETRAGLSVGNTIFSGVEPASNLIDRAFADVDRWLETAAILFNSFDRSPLPMGTAPDGLDMLDFSPTDNTNVVLAALRTEIETLGKAYKVRRADIPRPFDARGWRASSLDWRRELAGRVIEEYVILSSLARLTYTPAPMIDTVIELASVITNTDLRREARQLSDIGLIGMDAREIIEHLNA